MSATKETLHDQIEAGQRKAQYETELESVGKTLDLYERKAKALKEQRDAIINQELMVTQLIAALNDKKGMLEKLIELQNEKLDK